MINGLNKNQNEYRKVALASSSSLKDFSLDKRLYYKRYILGEPIEEKTNQAIITGNLVDCLLLEEDKFDERFHMSCCANAPTGLMEAFVEALYSINKASCDEDGNSIRSFEDVSKEAYVASGFKITYEAVIKKFVGSDAEIYYDEIRRVRGANLTVVTLNDVNNAQKIVDELKVNFVTERIVNLVDSDRYKVINQLQIEDFEIDGHNFFTF